MSAGGTSWHLRQCSWQFPAVHFNDLSISNHSRQYIETLKRFQTITASTQYSDPSVSSRTLTALSVATHLDPLCLNAQCLAVFELCTPHRIGGHMFYCRRFGNGLDGSFYMPKQYNDESLHFVNSFYIFGREESVKCATITFWVKNISIARNLKIVVLCNFWNG
jgi:hypothetical protein